MYKITITDKYNLLRFIGVAKDWVVLESFNTIPQLKLYVKKKLHNIIVLKEIDVAVKFMEDTNRNTAEFSNGLFTVAHYDEKIDIDTQEETWLQIDT